MNWRVAAGFSYTLGAWFRGDGAGCGAVRNGARLSGAAVANSVWPIGDGCGLICGEEQDANLKIRHYDEQSQRQEQPLQRLLRWKIAGILGAGLLCLGAALPAFAGNVRLGADTAGAFGRYVRLTDSRNDAELKRGTGLLWIDGLPEEERREAYLELRRGDVKVQKLETLDGDAAIPCPGGLIHHWVGVIFVPGASVDDVLAVLQDYEHQAVYYAPDVERSKIESRDGEHFRVFLRFRRHKVITVVLDTEHEVNYFRDAAGSAHSRSSAVRVAQVENAGTASEREKEPGDDDGFLWKMETWWRVEERDGGVYVQSEVASLTRGIPAGLGWLVGPFVTSIPRETLAFTLEATRKAVVGQKKR